MSATCRSATTAPPRRRVLRPDEIPGYGDTSKVCDDQDIDGNPLATPRTEKQIEAWWAPGAPVSVLGSAGGNVTEVTDADGNPVDCGVAGGGYYDPALPSGCSCGPNLVWCWPYMGLSGGHQQAVSMGRAARLSPTRVAERPLSDLCSATNVGDTHAAPLYGEWGAKPENAALDDDTTGGSRRRRRAARPMNRRKGDPKPARVRGGPLQPDLLSPPPQRASGG